MNRQLTITLLFSTLFSCFTYSQRLLVKYDFLKDEVSYFNVKRNGQIVPASTPLVKRNHNIRIEVVNFNPFLYDATAEFNETKIAETPNVSFMSLLSPLSLSASGGSFLQQLSADGVSRGGIYSDRRANESLKQVKTAYNKLHRAESVVTSIDYTARKLRYLQLNPYLPSDSIRAQMNELLQRFFISDHVSSSQFSEVMTTLRGDVTTEFAELTQAAAQFQSAYMRYAQRQDNANFEGSELNEYVQMLVQQASQFKKSFDIQKITEKMESVERIYQAIKNTPFEFNTTYLARGDEAEIKLAFTHKRDNENGAHKGDMVKKIKFSVFIRGDFKINSSIGLAFPYHSENDVYINRDSVITRIDGNNYTPNIAAYLNYYPYTGKSVQVGGTFGIGVPISSDNRNFNFLLGGSVMFGSDSKMVLHGGAVLGQVKKLNNGFEIGDNLGGAAIEVPLRNAYEWGGFVGVSFSILNVNN